MSMKSKTIKKGSTYEAEERLMKVIYSQVAEMADVRTGLNVLVEILNHMTMYGSIKRNTVVAYRECEQEEKYAIYLKKQGYVRSRLGVYYPGKKLKELQTIPGSCLSTESELLIIGDFLKNDYFGLVDGLNLQNVVPYARIANAYYLTALESGEMPRMWEFDVRTRMMDLYDLTHRRPRMKTVKHLRDLCEVGVLLTEDQRFYGNKSILKEFSELMD